MAITVGVNGRDGDRFALLAAAAFAAQERVTLRVLAGPHCGGRELDEWLHEARRRAAERGLAPPEVELRPVAPQLQRSAA